jgi:hypothetical protein
MIVRLQRSAEGSGSWILEADDDSVDVIEPTPEIEAMMEGEQSYFLAERIEGGWDIQRRVPDQSW